MGQSIPDTMRVEVRLAIEIAVEHQNGFPEGGSLHGWGPFGQRGPELYRLAAADVWRSPPGLRHLPSPRRLAWSLVTMVLSRTMLSTM